MNKLRELMDIKNQTNGRDYTKKQYDVACSNLHIYLFCNVEAIADLIDAAKECGLAQRPDHPLTIAVNKLEETK